MSGPRELERWRAAEAAGRQAEAEAALTALLGHLPRLDPRPGFAARVAATATARAAVAARAAAARRPAWRWAAAAGVALVAGALGLVAAGLASPLAGPLFGPLAGSIRGKLSLAALIDGLSAALTTLAGWLSGALGVWELLADVGDAFAAAAGTGPVAVSLLAGLAVAALALRRLSALIATERSWSHVPSPG